MSGKDDTMDTASLKEFLALAETQNFWEASELLFMNESTLSKHIKKLENELQVPLFDRSTRKVSLTPFGKCLIPYARSIVETEKNFFEELGKQIQIQSKQLVLGVIPSMVQYRITDILVDFRKKHPNQSAIQVLEGDTTYLTEALIHGACSMAFLRDSDLHPIDDTVFEKLPYTKDRLCILMPSDHPKASQKSVSLPELSEEEFVILNQGTLLNQLFTSLCASSGFRPHIALECKRMDSIFDLVAQHMGISLMTDKHFNTSAQASAAGQSLTLVPLTPALYSQTYLCYLKNTTLNATATAMLEYMKEYIKSD